MKRIKLYIASLLMIGTLAAPLVAPLAVSHADTPKNEVCQSLGAGNDCKSDSSGGLDIGQIFKVVINILSFIVGVVAVIMVIISGFKYVTSNGDSNSISSAKNTLLYAIIGIVIVAFAQFIVFFVLNKLGIGKN